MRRRGRRRGGGEGGGEGREQEERQRQQRGRKGKVRRGEGRKVSVSIDVCMDTRNEEGHTLPNMASKGLGCSVLQVDTLVVISRPPHVSTLLFNSDVR